MTVYRGVMVKLMASLLVSPSPLHSIPTPMQHHIRFLNGFWCALIQQEKAYALQSRRARIWA